MPTKYRDLITVLSSASPIPSHPSDHIIQETIRSVRYHLPDSRMYLMHDGIRPEQLDHEARYNIYFRKLAAKIANGPDHDLILWPFQEFTHQAGMTMRILEEVTTPLVLFVEADTPLLDRPIDWGMICDVVNRGMANYVRLHYAEEIHKDHQHLMHGKLTENLIKTSQFHMRPSIMLTRWFENLLHSSFTTKSRSFIEDVCYSPISWSPWEDFRCCVYDPDGTGKNMLRSGDLNGRAGEQKFDILV